MQAKREAPEPGTIFYDAAPTCECWVAGWFYAAEPRGYTFGPFPTEEEASVAYEEEELAFQKELASLKDRG